MSHLSIAVIRKKNPDKKFDYLILEENGVFKFFESLNSAIGSSFHFSSFKRSIIEYFILPDLIEIEGSKIPIDFEIPPHLFLSNRRNPHATAYLYELSKHQINAVNTGIETKAGIWTTVQWIPEDQLTAIKPWKKEQAFLLNRESPFKQPQFTNELRASLKKIVEAKENGKLVIFAGAGVSIDSGVPGWDDLIRELKNDVVTELTDFKKIAQLYRDSRGEKEYQERVQQILKHGKTIYNPVHQKITDLNPTHIITTNYDTHFEQVLESKALPYSIIRADSDLPYSKGSSLYVKMHGDFGLRNIVLSENDYQSYKDKFSLIQSFIRETFASKLVLFIGFKFTDSNLQFILSTVQEILQKNIQPPYLFSTADSENEFKAQQETLKEYDIRVLRTEDALKKYYDEVELHDDKDNLKLVSNKGQDVYRFLRVIEKFDVISDSLENQRMENQFVQSLERFEELGSIPQDVLVSILPFRLKQRSKRGSQPNAEFTYYEPFQMETSNEDLLAFLNEKKDDKGVIKFLSYKDNSLSSSEQKLHKCFKLLYSSGVRFISRKGDTSSARIELHPINKTGTPCKCPRCLLDRFEIKELLQSLHSLSAKALCERDYNDEGLYEAYGFLKTGQLVKAFYSLEEVKRVAIQSGRHITYFIASYNQMLMRPMFHVFYESKYNEEEIESIRQKIDLIDLHTFSQKLPVSPDVQRCLRFIMDNIVYRNTLERMDEDFESVRENYRKFKKPGFSSSGPVYWYRIQVNFLQARSFYHQNLLFTDENYTFSRMAFMYLESMIASFSTSDRYEQRLTAFPSFFNNVLVQYGYATDIIELFKKYEVTELPQNESVGKLLKDFEGFLESGYERSTFLGEKILQDASHHALAQSSSYYRHRITRTFNNFLVLIIHVKLSDEQLNRIVDKIIHFLSKSEIFNAADSLKFFSQFVAHYIERIQEIYIQRIAFYILSGNIWSGSLINSFCYALVSKKKAESIFDEDFYKVLSRRIEQKREWTLRTTQIIPFYTLLKDDQKPKLSALIEGYFDSHPGSQWDTYIKAYAWKMWNPDSNPRTSDLFLNHVVKHAANFPEYTISENGFPVGSSFSEWNNLVFAVEILYCHKLLDSDIAIQLRSLIPSSLFKWVLKPKEFDYSQFELNWVLVFSVPEIIQELKSVPQFHEAVQQGLKKAYNVKAAEHYYKEYK